MIKNKRGQVSALFLFFTVVAIVMVIGLFIAFGGAIIDIFADEIVPTIQGIGTIGDANITEYADYSIVPLNNALQSYTWLGGIFYFIGILGIFALAILGRLSSNKWFIVIFIAFAILFLMLGIFISNIYEDVYNGTDELAMRLKDQTILSFLMLNSPVIFTAVIFISGIVLFSGVNDDEQYA